MRLRVRKARLGRGGIEVNYVNERYRTVFGIRQGGENLLLYVDVYIDTYLAKRDCLKHRPLCSRVISIYS